MNKTFEKADPSKVIFSHRFWQISHTFPPFLRNMIKCNPFLKLNYQQTNYFFPGTREEQAVSSLLKLVPVRLEYQHLQSFQLDWLPLEPYTCSLNILKKNTNFSRNSRGASCQQPFEDGSRYCQWRYYHFPGLATIGLLPVTRFHHIL